MFTTRKILALLLAVLMLVSLAACGGKEEKDDGGEKNTETTQATEVNNPTDATDPAENLTIHENTFFTVGYREEDGWTLAEDDAYAYEYGGEAYLRIIGSDGYTDILVRIQAYKESASSFRERLYNNGVDLKAYAEGTWATESVGGLTMAYVDDAYGERSYFDRNEAAGISYTIYAEDWEDPRVPALVEKITFSASGTDNIDPPWSWDGEPYAGGTLSEMVGSYTLTGQFLPIDESMVTFETFEHDLAVVGDTVYLLSNGELYQLAYDGETLEMLQQIPLPDEYSMVEKGADGEIVLSGFMSPILGHDGSSALYAYDGPDYFTVAPGGAWGISWFVSGDDCKLYSFENGSLVEKDIAFNEVDVISQLCIDSQYILVCGSSAEDDEHYVFVYDHSGALQMQLGGEPDGWGLGSVTYAVSTPNGFLALDGNMREVVLWTADGTWIGAADDSDLFGTYYPWFASADMAEDGSILIVMTEERPDESADEVVIFKLSGF